MKFIGNYRDWLQDEWITYVQENEGIEQPKAEFVDNDIEGAVERGERAEFCEFQKKYGGAGYDVKSLLYYIFDGRNFPFDIGVPPWVKGYKEGVSGTYFNLFKYKPGHILPIHSDRVTKFEKNCTRYWMSWLDYVPGHILIYDDKLIAPYRAGDVYEFDDPFAIHGAANIGLSERITFQFTIYDEQ